MSVLFQPYADVNRVGIGAISLRAKPLGSNVNKFGQVRLRRPAPSGTQRLPGWSVTLRHPQPLGSDVQRFGSVALRHPAPYGFAFAAPPVRMGVVALRQPRPYGTGQIPLHGTGSAILRHPRPLGANVNKFGLVTLRKPQPWGSDRDARAGALIYILHSPGYVSMLTGTPMNLLTDSMQFDSSSSAQGVLALLDAIAFGDEWGDLVTLPVAIAVSVAFGDSLLGGVGGARSDGIEFGDDTVALALHIASLIDGFTVAATNTGGAVIFGFLSDKFAFDDSLDLKQQILAALLDGIEFGMSLYTGEDTYTAWVMTPETRAMRSYSNWDFNSYAQLNGRLIAAREDGIYVLEGDTDNGRAIHASVRSGLMDFGTRQLKRMSRAYLGYTADGTLAFRVVTTSPEGKKLEFSYRVVAQPAAGAPVQTRAKIGKGLQSVYWQFVLDNKLDGGRFELHDVTVLPITLSRRVRS